MFDHSSTEISTKLNQKLKKQLKDFDGVVTFSLDRVSTHVMLLVNNASRANLDEDTTDNGGGKALSHKQKSQKAVRKVIAEWAAHWRMGDYEDVEKQMQDVAIPEEYLDAVGGDGSQESSDDDAETMDEEDMDMDIAQD